MATLTKASIFLGLAYSFTGLVHYHHGDKHGGMQIVCSPGEVAESSTSGLAGSKTKE